MLINSLEYRDFFRAQFTRGNDAKIIATAIAAKVAVLITGDQDLLVLQDVQGIRILTPAQFLDVL